MFKHFFKYNLILLYLLKAKRKNSSITKKKRIISNYIYIVLHLTYQATFTTQNMYNI